MNFKIIGFISILLISCSDIKSTELILGTKVLKIEIAKNDLERSKGLMYRETLNEDSGMLFIFDKEMQVSFWMKNTLIPLSIAYIDKHGKILEIYDMKPQSLEPIQSKRSSIKYALEVNKGYFEKNDINPGYLIDLSPVFNYLKSSN